MLGRYAPGICRAIGPGSVMRDIRQFLCIIISVIACILAIWDFTKTDALWRTVATCIVVSAGMMAFGVTNILFGPKDK